MKVNIIKMNQQEIDKLEDEEANSSVLLKHYKLYLKKKIKIDLKLKYLLIIR